MEPIFEARHNVLEKAKAALAAAGIGCRISKARRQAGLLSVSSEHAERARRILVNNFDGRLISANEALWFQCYSCGAEITEGTMRCPKCDAVVGDPHGK